jgi:hypothetical protein
MIFFCNFASQNYCKLDVVRTLNFIDLFAGAYTCFSALFDKELICLDKNFQVIFSANLQKSKSKDYFAKYFAPIERVKLQMPQKYLPKRKFLEWHLDTEK